jgi:uncharacterized repeat protein (TIGR01451 family)
VTYTWTDDTTAPVLPTLPAGGGLGCNPTPPSCNNDLKATDNCDGTVAVICSAGSVTGDDCNKSQIFTYTATDACGNSVSDTVTYTWKVDTTNPSITCPPNITVNSDPDACGAYVTVSTPTANDNCGVASVVGVRDDGLTLTDLYPVGTTTIIWTVTDNCGNTAQCSHTVTVTLNAELSIAKSADLASATVGDVITYTYTVTNTGNVTLTNVAVTDSLLGPVTNLSPTTLPVSGVATGTLQYTVLEADICGPIENTATATATDPCDNTVGPVSAIASVPTTYVAKLVVTKTIDSPFDTKAPALGDTIGYRIEVENTGNVSLSGVTVADSLLVTVLFDPISDDGNGVLDVGETWTYTGSYEVTEDDLYGPIVNEVTVTATDPCGHPVDGSATAATVWENTPPTAQDQTLTTCKNTPITFDLVARDLNIFFDPENPDVPQIHPLVFSILGAPENGTVSGNLANVTYTADHYARVTVTYTPTLDFLGTETITFVVQDPFDEFAIGTVMIDVIECGGEEVVGGGGAVTPEVVINEVAWGGTKVSPDDEWIELVNNTDETIDLSGWTLRWRRKHPTTPEERKWKVVELAGRIGPNDYYLMERTHDDVVSDIHADLIYDTVKPYHLALSDLGEVMELVDPSGDVVDTANGDPRREDGWPAGYGKDGAPLFGTMERIDPLSPDVDKNWDTNRYIIINGLDAERDCLVATAGATNEEPLIRALAGQDAQVVQSGEVITISAIAPAECDTVECLPHVTLIQADEVAGGGGAVVNAQEALSGRRVEGTRSYEFSVDTSQLAPGTYDIWITVGQSNFHHLCIVVEERT